MLYGSGCSLGGQSKLGGNPTAPIKRFRVQSNEEEGFSETKVDPKPLLDSLICLFHKEGTTAG